MTQTFIEPTPQASTAPALYLHPFDILLNLVATLLAPMFLCITGGDAGLARMAALETISAYRARDLADLIAIAQIVGNGLAALGSLSLSMQDDISLSMTLRLRGNANALNRSAEQNRRAMRVTHVDDSAPDHAEATWSPETPAVITKDDSQTRTGALMNDTAAKMLADEANARLVPRTEQPKKREATPVADPQTASAHTMTEKRHQKMWAIAMVKEASEITASIPGLPPMERNAASIRAGMLSSTANHLLTGGGAPLFGAATRAGAADGAAPR